MPSRWRLAIIGCTMRSNSGDTSRNSTLSGCTGFGVDELAALDLVASLFQERDGFAEIIAEVVRARR